MLRNLTIYKIVLSQTSEPTLEAIHRFPQKLLKITCQLKNGVKYPHIQAVINRNVMLQAHHVSLQLAALHT